MLERADHAIHNKIQPVKTKFFTIIHLVSYNASYEAVTSTNI